VSAAADRFHEHVLSAAQKRRLLEIVSLLPSLLGPTSVADAVRRIAAVVDVKVALVRRQNGAWAVLAESAPEPAVPPVDERVTVPPGQKVSASAAVECWSDVPAHWTFVGVRSRRRGSTLLVIEGDWTDSGTTLVEVASGLIRAEQTRALTSRARVRLATHRLARTLAAATGLQLISDIVVRSIAEGVGVRIASLAVPDAEGRRLSIVATYGYPLVLVKHLRIQPGVGIVGTVFQTRSPLRVRDVATHPGILRRRLRYKTDSLMALPLEAGGEVVGVLCLSDRIDGGTFSHDDMSTLRALAAPAALALAAERARGQAESMARAAAVDPVSGLFNRRYFYGRFEEELQRARRQNTPVALLLLDIDDFKKINDTLGHLVGDQVIRDTADILRRSVRVFDVCTRYGGEEFAIVMPGSGLEDAANIAERIRAGIEGYRSPEVRAGRITASIGVAVSSPDTSVRELIARADQALYLAKRSGKNQVRTSGVTAD
jgi:diguanylate cyclase (GGDEF)-like protein